MEPKKNHQNEISWQLFTLLITVLLIVLYLYFSPFDSNIFIYYLSTTPPFLLPIPSIIFATYLSYERSRYTLIAWLVVLIYLFFICTARHSLTTIFNRQQSPVTTAKQMRICSWNTAYFFEWGGKEGFKTLQETKCDFIFLQEVWKSETFQKELSDIRDVYLPDHNFISEGEFVTFYPKDLPITVQAASQNVFLALQTMYKEKPISLVSVHFWNPVVPRPTLVSGKLVYKNAKDEREAQAKELFAFLKDENLHRSVFMIGDFNSTQNSSILSHIQQQTGLEIISESLFSRNNTYPAHMPLIRIDYAFAPKVLGNNSFLQSVCLPKISDHCLMILDVLL